MSAETTASNATRPRKKKGAGLWIALVVVVAAVGGGYYWKQNQKVASADKPLIATVTRGDIETTIAASGSLQAYKTVAVGAQASGLLEELFVEIGDEVTEGQLLAKIDARTQQNKVRTAELSLQSAEEQLAVRQSALKLAEQNWERQQMLYAEGATSEQEYQNAEDRVISARASLDAQIRSIETSKINLSTDQTQLSYTEVRAPVSGTVVTIDMEKGRTLNASQSSPTIMKIEDLSKLTVKTEISEADMGNVRVGQEVYFTTVSNGNRRFYSTLRDILPGATVNNNVVTYPGLFDIENDDRALYPGMSTQVFFVISSVRDVVKVPVGALTFADTPRGPAEGGQRMALAGNGEARPAADGEIGGSGPRAGGRGRAGGQGFNGAPRQGGGGRAGGRAGGGGAGAAAGTPRRATVKVWDAATETSVEREVMIGVVGRTEAEVLSGLEPGEQVVAGIIQANPPPAAQTNNNNNNNNNQNWNNQNFNRGGGGGFPGGGGFSGGGGGGGRGNW